MYSVDLGTWESGITVPFRADNDDAAVKKAFEIGREKELEVVQVRAAAKAPGPLIWCQFSGRLNRC